MMTRLPESGLQRSRHQRILGGVCGGLAEWLGWDVTLVRLLFVGISVASAAFPGILVYLVLWVLMPQRRDSRYAFR
jgi:phage shock protein C